uniref:PDZ domain-containing protein n=1 Tax=Macrostomum lignano TaxID=282301 RepID=A0A1I8J6V1_9PLAT
SGARRCSLPPCLSVSEPHFNLALQSFFITHVVAGSVAAYAGLKSGDEIVAINGRQLEGMSTRDVLQIIRRCEVSVRLAYRPRAVVARIREVRLMKDNGVVGVRLQKKPDGLYIEFVKLGTPAHAAGLKEGDQVLKVNGHFVTEWSMEGAMALLKSLTEQLVLLVRETLPLVAAQAQPAGHRRQAALPSGHYVNLRSSSRSTLALAPACSQRTSDGYSAAKEAEALCGQAVYADKQLPPESAPESAPASAPESAPKSAPAVEAS